MNKAAGGDAVQGYQTLKGRLLRRVLGERGMIVGHPLGDEARRDLAIVRETRALATMLVQDAAALELLSYARSAAMRGGSMAEAGVFAGGTARLICEAKGAAHLHLFDVFETLQSAPAAIGEPAGTAEVRAHFRSCHGERAAVEQLLAPYRGVHIHPGVFPHTTRGLENERFSFVHIDLDIQGAIMAALEFFHPRLLQGAVIVGDDYNDAAVRGVYDRYFAGCPDTRVALPWGQVLIVRTGPT